LNPAAFRAPTDFTSTVGLRNNIRSPYGIDQIDLAVRRRFNITERVKLDFRAEFFNVLNHPMFGFNLNTSFWASCFHFPCTSAEVWPSFGKVGPGAVGKLQTLNQLPSSWGTRLSPLYAFGGNRSGQLALKLSF
jgi:hypothetical protein